MIDSNYYMYRQYSLANLIAEKGFQTSFQQYELKLLAVYLRDIMGMKPKERKAELQRFCKEHVDGYHVRAWYEDINRAINYSRDKEHVLVECPSVTMYKSEVEFVDGLDVDENCKRVIWCVMVQKKLDKFSYEAQHGGEYKVLTYNNNEKRIKSLKRIGKLKGVKDIGLEVFRKLALTGLVKMMDCKNDPIRLLFADKIAFEGELVVEVTNYEKLGDYWEWVHGDTKIGLCKECGSPFRMTTGNRMHCDEHKKYAHVLEVRKKICACIDCGKEFEVDARNTTKIRCDNCQHEHRNAIRRKNCTGVI